MFEQLKTALDEFIDRRRVSGWVRRKKIGHSFHPDIYEAVKSIIRDVEIRWKHYFTANEYEEAIRYICERIKY